MGKKGDGMDNKWLARLAPLGLVVAANVAMFDLVSPTVGIPLVLVTLGVAWRYTPGFWRLVLGGLIGGVVAGLLILGPGFRVAMRVVAIIDPTRATEFTLGGTIFIVVGIGAIMGGIQSVTVNLVRPSLRLQSPTVSGVVLGSVALVVLLLLPGDVQSELFELGAGPLMNIPMFGGICMAYGLAAMALADRVASWMLRRRGIDAELVAAYEYERDTNELVGG
jgi:hypothetical protein